LTDPTSPSLPTRTTTFVFVASDCVVFAEAPAEGSLAAGVVVPLDDVLPLGDVVVLPPAPPEAVVDAALVWPTGALLPA
jgi:hypothetical protein